MILIFQIWHLFFHTDEENITHSSDKETYESIFKSGKKMKIYKPENESKEMHKPWELALKA